MSTRPANAVALAERHGLADLLAQVGPDAPTLCGGWSTRHLAAHLVVRATRPDAALGIVLPLLAAHNDRVIEQVAQRPWPDLVAEVRQGPPRWSPQSLAVVDAESNTIEYFVHHEDVRRAASPWGPRHLDAETAEALWRRVGQIGAVTLRRCPVGVVAAPTDGPAAGTERTLRRGARSVVLAGPVGEIVLAVYGRSTSGLEIRGDGADVAAFVSFPR